MQRHPLITALSLGLFAGAAASSVLAETPLEQQLKDLESFQVIAHRGASGHAPESTMAAYTLAHEWGADYLELDAQLTSDGELVIFHDDTLDRTSDGEGHINDYTLEELKALDTGTWFNAANADKADPAFKGAQILTLDALFKRFGHDTRYYIEAKSPQLNPGLEEALVEALEEHSMIESGRVLVQSFEQDSLLKVHELNEHIPLIQLVWYSPSETDSDRLTEWTGVTPGPTDITDANFQAIAEYASGISTNVTYDGDDVISAAFIQKAQENGLPVHVYTLNNKADMQRLLDWGVSGVFTDFPDRLIELVE